MPSGSELVVRFFDPALDRVSLVFVHWAAPEVLARLEETPSPGHGPCH
jgi:hypothetical protein